MGKKTTIQDIADALGLSRNTVSKAINNTGILADSTREKILQKAAEMEYKQFVYYPTASAASVVSAASVSSLAAPKAENREIAVLMQSMPDNSHFASRLLETFQEKISAVGYRLSFYLIREQEIAALQLPSNFDRRIVDGIICIEMFDPAYSRMLGHLDIPLLFIDSAVQIDFSEIDADFLFMENRNSICHLTNELIQAGKTRLAFAGDINHCYSFYGRYQGFMTALAQNGLAPATDQFTRKEVFANFEGLTSAISKMDELPEVFVCANDFVAIDLIKSLKICGYSVPEDVLITGFDNSNESKIIEPHLTTVHIPSADMGYIAGDLMLSRITMPDMPYRTTYARTTIQYRNSTGSVLEYNNQ